MLVFLLKVLLGTSAKTVSFTFPLVKFGYTCIKITWKFESVCEVRFCKGSVVYFQYLPCQLLLCVPTLLCMLWTLQGVIYRI